MSLGDKKMTQNRYSEMRPGEVALASDPALSASDAHLAFIGRIGSAWQRREDCPKNMAAARETGQPAQILLDEPFRPGLQGLAGYSHVAILTWFHEARRELIVQKPWHAPHPSGTFALRSPIRPNPIGLHIARLVSVDEDKGILSLDAIDALDGTPVIDIKPYFASVDAIPEATRPDRTAT